MSWSVLQHSLCVHCLRKLRIVVIQVRDIDRDRRDGLALLGRQSLLGNHLCKLNTGQIRKSGDLDMQLIKFNSSRFDLRENSLSIVTYVPQCI